MSKTSNNQKIQVLKIWLEDLKVKGKAAKKKKVTYVVDDEE